jgi:hypothetical protein
MSRVAAMAVIATIDSIYNVRDRHADDSVASDREIMEPDSLSCGA